MSDVTLYIITRQLKAMNCAKYKLGIFNRSENWMINKDLLDYEEIIKMVSWLKFQNAEGRDIYITQADCK
jgi:hypothetical protein